MQWFGRRREESPDEFWRQTAAKRGGEIGFLTFATFMGLSSNQPLDLPGLLYLVGDTVWFEDTEISFARGEVRTTQLVSRSGAARCIAGAVAAEKLSPVSAVGRILSIPIVQVSLSNETSLF